MGPSGSGKTTLLNVLARRTRSNYTGECRVNNSKLDNEAFGQISSYVEQEDALIGSMTVWETLRFAADLALPRSVNRREKRQRIQTLLEAFGIQNQASTLVGTPIRKGISGGQKRRVSVASQLITCPKILFLDEPTSGLDSTSSYEVISYLRELAKANNVSSALTPDGSSWNEANGTAHRHREYPSTIHQHLSAIRYTASPFRRQDMLLRPGGTDRTVLRQYRSCPGCIHQPSRIPPRSRQL